ncbi:MAG: PEPxxWA-CTERM sorting domain-containing protein [Azoarcus sp.]|jgi:hypothetical protein|nr:PEPxxWA-CTERM sorting domain-containing protein [Azoarcus sp.]
MKFTKFAWAAKVAALVFVGGACGTASAEIVQGISLGAQKIVDQFNSMNNGKGLVFKFEETNNNGFSITNLNSNYKFADLGAYGYETGAFSSFKAAPGLTYNNANSNFQGIGKLNYGGSATWTDYPGTANNNATLSVGAAYMAMMYATQGGNSQYYVPFVPGNSEPYVKFLQDWSYLGNRDEIRSRFGVEQWDNSSPYLQSLLALNGDKSYWLAAYDPDKKYTEIGDYSVFVMNNYRIGDGSAMGNMIYVAGAVPEPETWAMLLAGFGIVGAAARRRAARK